MVSKRRLDDGFNGYRSPIIPKAPRSVRRRRPHAELAKESNLSAFDLLAAVAGELLQESESFLSSNAPERNVQPRVLPDENEQQLVGDKESLNRSAFVPVQAETDSVSEPVSDAERKIGEDIKRELCEVENGDQKAASDSFSCRSDEEKCVNTNMLISSENSGRLPLYRDPVPISLQQKCWNNNKVGIRDDDDNSYRCKFRDQRRIGHRRVRKMLASRYRKLAPKAKHYNTVERMRSFHQYRKRICTIEKCHPAPIKKRKLNSRQSFTVTNDHDTTSGNGASATSIGHLKPKDCRVKFSIKSFRVPELYVEVPENASIGSLKRTVMEAVTAILGSGIRVGVVLQGKKVGDDDKTLQQAGISPSSKLDSLGFMLEPSVTHASPSTAANSVSSAPPSETDQQLPPGSPAAPKIVSGIAPSSVDPPLVTKFDDNQENGEFLSSQDTPMKEISNGEVSDSMALVPAEALAVVPLNSKPKRSELSQRRTRRPFSISEVEALVEAVERLGTGRWRDVKLGAFENADHRTYVDLKDKWKTLVHTASISPQQRRGEPVPQELLDRVLSAHSYWLAKQYGKQQQQSIEPVNTEPDQTVKAA